MQLVLRDCPFYTPSSLKAGGLIVFRSQIPVACCIQLGYQACECYQQLGFIVLVSTRVWIVKVISAGGMPDKSGEENVKVQ